MEFGGAPAVALPVGESGSTRVLIQQWRAGVVRQPALVQSVFGERVAATVGPAYVGRLPMSPLLLTPHFADRAMLQQPSVG